MKTLLQRALRKIGRFFWSRGFLKFILWTITLIALFYAEENWRGARMWAATKAKWETQGESLDYFGTKFIPPAITDSQNLAAIPLFQLAPDPEYPNQKDLHLLVLEHAMRSDRTSRAGSNIPSSPRWQVGELSDPDRLQKAVAAEYAAAFKDTAPPPKSIDQFEALFPFLSELRSFVGERPGFRLALEYANNPPDGRALGAVVDTIRLSKILTLHAALALDDHQSDLALNDLRINFQIAAGIKRDPTLVGGLVAIGMISLGHGVIWSGLAHRQWSDANLVELDHLLSSIDLLSGGQFALRAEAAGSVADIEYYRHSHLNIYDLLQGMDDDGKPLQGPRLMARLVPIWASGWWEQDKCPVADSLLATITVLDPPRHRAYPQVASALQDQIDAAKRRHLAFAPWNIWATLAIGPIVPSLEKFAAAQVWVDEARIACALERYRLTHGAYPPTLEALVPAYINELPRDVIDGEPYRYRLNGEGDYLLYSVGWNQTDDGGKASYQFNNDSRRKAIDVDHGDWVWPTPPR